MGKRIESWKKEINKHKHLIILSIIFLAVAIFLNYMAGEYLQTKSGVVVSDIILDNIPTINLGLIYIYGLIIILTIAILYPLFFEVRKLHVVISQLSLLIMLRSFFITLTHLGAPTNAILVHASGFWRFFDVNNAFFFSGHTAVPFLGFLIFRKSKLGIFFLIATIIMMITVLLMHVHYSIDVFAALFITYGSFKIGEWLFKKINHY